jgi:hypothetical protein
MEKNTLNVRKHYIHHPSNIPVQLAPLPSPPSTTEPDFGGLCCLWNAPFDKGTRLRLSISDINPHYWAEVQVIDYKPAIDDHKPHRCFELQLAFVDPKQAFRMRLVEQLCHINHYRDQIVTQEGRQLSPEQAAHEWIGRYAAGFPAPQY